MIAAKSAEPHAKLPGTIHSVPAEVEQAGGKASTGYETIMDIQPTEIHQRVAVILGSRNEVDMCLSYHGLDYSEEPTID